MSGSDTGGLDLGARAKGVGCLEECGVDDATPYEVV